MKPHLVVRLRPGAGPAAVAAWHESIDDKAGATESLTAAVDAVLRRHRIHGWVTHEFAPAAPDRRWTADEVASGLNRVFRIVLRDDSAIPPALVDEISVLPEVEYVRVGRVGVAPLPVSRAQSAAGADWARETIGLAEAHRWTRGSAEVTIAVLDTGVDTAHRELKAAVRPGFDFVDIVDGAGVFFADHLDADDDPADPVGHGTHVAGIAAGEGLAMPAGAAPGCVLLPVRVLGAMRHEGRPVGAGLVDNINTALKWAIDQGADVVNMSFGLPHTGGGLPHREVVEYGLRRGVVLVAAAGNDGRRELYYPGSLPGVIAVGATDPVDEVAPFSTYGPQVLLTAPGTEIYSTFPGGGYAFASGTSQAAPFVTGAAALLQSFARQRTGRRLDVAAVRRLLVLTADRPDPRFRSVRGGHGRLNVADAVRLLDREITRPAPRGPTPLTRTTATGGSSAVPPVDDHAERTGS
jgi:subtilisin family serine protease